MGLHTSPAARARTVAPWCALVSTLLLLAACSGVDNVSPTDGSGGTTTTTGANTPAPADGVRNGDETDVDCGGSAAARCAEGKQCREGSDCATGSCRGGKCAAPAPDDGAKNGDETDVDCGGSKAPKCADGKACKAHADCASDACNHAGKCVADKSCTGHAGGDTCGAGETGDPGAKHESCCTRVKVDRPANQGGKFELDKFHVTAGRMRAFVERWNGDLQAWAKTSPKGWDDGWTDALPSSIAEANDALGPNRKRGCNVKNQGGRTYWQPPVDGDAAEVSDFSKETLDEKVLNCVPWHLAQALCVSDGGRLAKASEIQWEFESRGRAQGSTQYPWQWRDTSAYNAAQQDERLAHQYSYATPSPGTLRMVGSGGNAYPLDHAFYMAPPGRHPKGASMSGAEDIAGNVLTWVADNEKRFVWTMSWEQHNKNLSPTAWNANDGPDGYYAIGARCARE
mgnify:CR=1 FL=1